MADAAPRFAALGRRVRLLETVGATRDAGEDQRRAAHRNPPGRRPGSRTECSDYRQPVGADGGKKGAVGYDRNKQRKGSKRQIAVDTQGWLLRVLVHPANEQDKVAAKWLLRRLPLWDRLKLFIFDSGYASDALMNWCQKLFGVDTEVTNRGDQPGFVV